MERFSSLRHVPAETRRILRDRFARFLPSQHATSVSNAKGITLSDELLLELLLNLTFDFGSDLGKARATYMAALPEGGAEPSLEQLIAEGWFRIVWGRLSTSREVARTARAASVGTMTAYSALRAKQFEQAYTIAETTETVEALADTVAAIKQGALHPQNIGCQSPEWVAARLWDRTFTDFPDPNAALRTWVDRWQQLGYPSLVPSRAWNETAANAFREAALDVLGSEPSLVGWEALREDILKQMALASERSPSSIEGYVPAVPATLVDRAMWLNDHSLERVLKGLLFEGNDVFGPIRLLLEEIEAQDYAPAPNIIAGRLIVLAIERPEFLNYLIFKVGSSSVLLADMILNAETSALACLLIAQWQPPSSAWDRELTTRDNQHTKVIAFADAVSVMGSFLEQGFLGAAEAAALLNWFHQKAQPGFIDDLGNSEAMLTALRGELARQSSETMRAMIAALTSTKPGSGLGTSTFAAALDIVDIGKLAGDIDPTPLVTAYIQSVQAGDYSLSANRVSVGGATALCELAIRTPLEDRKKFLSPVDIKGRLTAAHAAGENPYSVADAVAKSIRAHVRILCRAMVGWTEIVPDDLVNALIDAVRVGAYSHAEKRRVAAFCARYETDRFRGSLDRPIAADLGAALGALTGDHRERLLVAILETDEPMVLAQLLSLAPHTVRDRIRKRITGLTPTEAGEILSLTEAQGRIEELLSAGLEDAAARFIEAERDLKTMGNAPGREMTRLRATLRLKLLRGDWTGIANTETPSNLSLAEQPSAAETINFFNAVAALANPAGAPQVAEQTFSQLQHHRPDVSAYVVNLFAARIRILLGSDLFEQLKGTALVRGRNILIEAEQMMLHVRAVSNYDTGIFSCNKAVLLLALGQAEQANILLATLHPTRLRDRIAAYTAVALARMGRASEAMAILSLAEQELGSSDVLQAARAHIQSGTPFNATASVSSDDDPVPRIKDALWTLSQMDHMRQATAFKLPPEPFETLVIEHVRSAAASVTSLVPMMRVLKLDSCEDDLSALIRELLISRLQFLGWSVPDQSKGGFSGRENPGERDLQLQKNSTTLSVIEAVVCKRPITQRTMCDELTRHFQKLFGYSTCTLFFHLTYSYIENPALILVHLKRTAEHDAPAGFKYRLSEDLPHTDSQPVGFIARYEGEFGEVKMVFLVLNMGQHRQRAAAKAAAKSGQGRKKAKLVALTRGTGQ